MSAAHTARMPLLSKVLYRKWVEDMRAVRLAINMPAHHCIFTGLDFNVRTRTESFWGYVNRLQQLRADALHVR